MNAKSIGIGCVLVVMTCVTGCTVDSVESLAPCTGDGNPNVAKPTAPVNANVKDPSMEVSAACAATDVALASELRAHVAQTSSFVGSAAVVLHDALPDAMVGTALDTIGLGSAGSGLDHTFDAATGEYVITAKTGSAVGSAELRFRLYWGEGHAQAGQPLMADALSPESYLNGPDLHVDLFDARVSVSYDSAGPLVSVFGWGDAPRNPAVVRVSDAEHVQANVRGLMADARIIIRVGAPDGVHTTLELATAKKSLADWIASPDPELHVVSGSTQTGSSPSKLTFTEWPRNGVEGQVQFESTAGVKGELTLHQGSVIASKLTCR